MITYYFAYGADMDSKELDLQHDRKRRPRIRFASSAVATLPGYKLICDIASTVRQGGIFNVVPDPASSVSGVIYALHPGDTISIAAMKQGDVAKYELSVLPVKVKSGRIHSALVLRAPAEKKKLVPAQAYLDIVIRAARKHNLPAEWLKVLQATSTAIN